MRTYAYVNDAPPVIASSRSNMIFFIEMTTSVRVCDLLYVVVVMPTYGIRTNMCKYAKPCVNLQVAVRSTLWIGRTPSAREEVLRREINSYTHLHTLFYYVRTYSFIHPFRLKHSEYQDIFKFNVSRAFTNYVPMLKDSRFQENPALITWHCIVWG